MIATPHPKLPPAALTPVGAEVFRGLTARPKTLSPWLFYDAAGSRLFEAIGGLPEYYLTRTERGILAAHAEEIVSLAAAGRRLNIVELGAGTATKTGLLLKAAVGLQGRILYRAIDVSQSALAEAKSRLEAELPGVTVMPQISDYTDGLVDGLETGGLVTKGLMTNGYAPDKERRLVLYIGSSIGNFDPEDALALLRDVRARLAPADGLLLGIDMVKDSRLLLAAYDDAAGVTAEFNRNALVRINRELETGFNPGLFRHRAIWNQKQSRIEMHLESRIAQRISIAALELEVRFAQGETIHTENSYKFTDRRVREMLAQAGFAMRRQWSDAQGWFGVYLATVS